MCFGVATKADALLEPFCSIEVITHKHMDRGKSSQSVAAAVRVMADRPKAAFT